MVSKLEIMDIAYQMTDTQLNEAISDRLIGGKVHMMRNYVGSMECITDVIEDSGYSVQIDYSSENKMYGARTVEGSLWVNGKTLPKAVSRAYVFTRMYFEAVMESEDE